MNDPLDKLLKEWKGIEPNPGFAEALERRLKAEPTRPLVRLILFHPLLAQAAAAAISLGIGAIIGATLLPQEQIHTHFSSASLSGRFVELAAKGTP